MCDCLQEVLEHHGQRKNVHHGTYKQQTLNGTALAHSETRRSFNRSCDIRTSLHIDQAARLRRTLGKQEITCRDIRRRDVFTYSGQ